MRFFLILVGMLFAGCAMDVNVTQDEPFDIHHRIDVTVLKEVFEAQCIRDFPAATDEEIDICANARLADFLEQLAEEN